MTSGIWKGVELVGWDNWHVNYSQISNKNLSKKNAELEVELDIVAGKENDLKITVNELLTGLEFKNEAKISGGHNKLRFNISIPNPSFGGLMAMVIKYFIIFLSKCRHIINVNTLKKTGIRDATIKGLKMRKVNPLKSI